MTHESTPPLESTLVVPAEASELPAGIPEVLADGQHLASEQVEVLKNYTLNATDKNTGDKHFTTAVNHMKTVSERVGDSLGLGEIAISAAALGSLSRDPSALQRSGRTLADKMIARGMQREHVVILMKLQQSFAAKPAAMNIGQTLKLGLDYLNTRTTIHGEDTSRAKVAFLVSSLAATQDVSLRRAILKQLQV